MNALKKFYYSICARIYSVGKVEAEQKRIRRFHNQASIHESAKLYESSNVINLSGDKANIIVGSNSHIYGTLTTLNFSGKISIGSNSSVGDLSRIVSSKSILIGNRVMIAHNVNILDNNSHPIDAGLRHDDFIANYNHNPKAFDLKGATISIEDDVWIGFNTIVLKGVRIGRGAIIGAGSVVTKDVEPWTINVGNPLRCVEKLVPQNI
jgi:acetyltransferase-like isoleucine patch superfamily enzyme